MIMLYDYVLQEHKGQRYEHEMTKQNGKIQRVHEDIPVRSKL